MKRKPETPSSPPISRRAFLGGGMGVVGAVVLGGCGRPPEQQPPAGEADLLASQESQTELFKEAETLRKQVVGWTFSRVKAIKDSEWRQDDSYPLRQRYNISEGACSSSTHDLLIEINVSQGTSQTVIHLYTTAKEPESTATGEHPYLIVLRWIIDNNPSYSTNTQFSDWSSIMEYVQQEAPGLVGALWPTDKTDKEKGRCVMLEFGSDGASLRQLATSEDPALAPAKLTKEKLESAAKSFKLVDKAIKEKTGC